MSTLVIVPCGQAKIWDKFPNRGPSLAQGAYTSTYHVMCQRYAQKFGDRWVILSAKYGLIDPDFEISGPYDETFNRKLSGFVSQAFINQHAYALVDEGVTRVIVLGGRAYVERVKIAFRHIGVEVPFEGLSMLKQMSAMKKALEVG